MNEKLSDRDLTNSGQLLNRFVEEVSAEEGTLSGGTRLGVASEALQQLKKTKISFGNPYHNLSRLNEEGFREMGIELSEIEKKQMKDRFDFYYMTLPVSMHPGRGVQFTRVECHLDFGPKGKNEPVVHSIFPRSEWRELLRLGRKLDLGLDGKLEWTLGSNLSEATASEVPADIKGRLVNKSEFKAIIAFPDYSYELGRTEIAATGEGNSECYWRIDKPELHKAQTVHFGVVFKVPKEKTSIKLTGLAAVEPDFKWLTANIKDVFEFLSDKIKRLLRMKDSERKDKDRLPIGCCEKWSLKLPDGNTKK